MSKPKGKAKTAKTVSKQMKTTRGRMLLPAALAVALIGAAALAGAVGGKPGGDEVSVQAAAAPGNMPIVSHRIVIETGTGGANTGWIEVSSFSWGMSLPSGSTGGGGATGRVQFQDFHFTKKIDKSSTILMKACATGQHLPKVTFETSSTDANGKKVQYMKWTMEEVLVSSYQVSGSGGGGELPMEEISMNFAKVTVDWIGPDATPGTTFEWDLTSEV